jgi:glycosyltransferase involved in cell wall biosynthesis
MVQSDAMGGRRAQPGDPLRVLMVAPTSFFGHYGGHIRILEEVRALQDLGHQITIVTYHKGEDVAGLSIERTARLPWHADYEVGSSRHKLAFDVYLAHKVLQVGLRFRPHIVHGHMHEGALIGGALARLLRTPLVFDFQGSLTGEMLDHQFLKADGPGFRFWHRLEQFICRLPQRILTSSVGARELLQNEFGVPAVRIVPLPDCADLEHFSAERVTPQQKERLRRKLGIPDGRPVVAYLGLLADYQGTPHLLQAASNLKHKGVDVHFLIMGYPNEELYAAQAARLGVSDMVTFTGRVNYIEEAPYMLALGDIAVSPKLSSSEGSGKVLNYMAMGQPVVAFDSRVHREYLGEYGIYVPRGDVQAFAEAIAALLRDEERRCRVGAALQQRAATKFSWAAAGARIDALYHELLT